MFRTLAGIESDDPGYSKIIIRPTPPRPGSNAQHKPIDWVKASHDSIHGRIETDWRINGDRFFLTVTIPANTTATVYLPAANEAGVTEGGKPLGQAKGVQLLRMDGGLAVVSIGSGRYHFVSTGGLPAAQTAIETSKPENLSLNPDNINLTGARKVAQWDFRRAADVAKWAGDFDNLKVDVRNGDVFLVATGPDPKMTTAFDQALSGPLAIVVKGSPPKDVSAQFFWASPTGGFSAAASNARPLKAAETVGEYLFKIGDGGPLGKLRFDPFSDVGEIRIESLTIYRLVD